jgi:putative heme-binding domain-containing protein
VGPELTGAQRTNVDYLLTNLVDPSALVGRDYRMTAIATESGRVVTGIVVREDDNAVRLQTANDEVTIPKDEIEDRKQSNVSMMPEGQLEKLTAEEMRDLFAYLMSQKQVELGEESEEKRKAESGKRRGEN